MAPVAASDITVIASNGGLVFLKKIKNDIFLNFFIQVRAIYLVLSVANPYNQLPLNKGS